MNGHKFAAGQIVRKPVEVVKGRILAGWAPKSPEPCSKFPEVLNFGPVISATQLHYYRSSVTSGTFIEVGQPGKEKIKIKIKIK
jgi:hypothetical protein